MATGDSVGASAGQRVDAVVSELQTKLQELKSKANATAVSVLTEVEAWVSDKLAQLEDEDTEAVDQS